MDKSFYVIPAGKEVSTSHVCYCGRCGKRQLLDQYNLMKHEQTCNPSDRNPKIGNAYAVDQQPRKSQIRLTDDVVLVEERNYWGYRLEGTEGDGGVASGILKLSICIPILIKIPGFTDRFSGMEWAPIFVAEFPTGSRNPRILCNETGYEMDVLLAFIRARHIRPISMESDRKVIRRVFPGLIDIYSLEMFVHIYRNKGYTTGVCIKPGTESWLFENTPNSKEWKALGVYEEKKDTFSTRWLGDYRDDKKNLRTGNVHPENVRRPASIQQQGKIPIYAALFKLRNDTHILQVVLKNGPEKTIFLFTRNYCSCSREVDLNEIFRQQYYLVGNAMKAIEVFDKAYPEYHLAAYVKCSENILTPLLAAGYHTGMELAAKAGACAIAENYNNLAVFDKSPCYLHNLKEMFGVPVSILRVLRRNQVNDQVLKRIKEIYDYQPAFVQFDFYTDSMIQFWSRADITHNRKRRPRAIEGISALSDKQILQILRYLQKHPGEGHYYCDYMRASAQLGEYEYGITPSIPIREAHDRAVSRLKNKHDRDTKQRFEAAVSTDDYLYFTTCGCKEDEEIFGKDPYIVMAPETSDDLFRESENMHNCVRIYVKDVASRSTRIYFLRKKEDPDSSFGTIEVSRDGGRLIQAKAFGNRKLPRQAQEFVIKWCKNKGISVNTGDINAVPYGIA